MSPLEIAGRAVADEWTRIFPGSRPTEEHRIRLARAALLALAECHLPERILDAACGENEMISYGDFRAICRAIANEGKDNG